MRRIFLFLSIFCSIVVSAQNDVAKEIKRIISDSSNKFSSFKSGVKYSIEYDIVYHSRLTIKGTKENEVSVNRLASEYLAVISDSLKKRGGTKTYYAVEGENDSNPW